MGVFTQAVLKKLLKKPKVWCKKTLLGLVKMLPAKKTTPKRKPGAAERDAKRIATTFIRRSKSNGKVVELVGASGTEYPLLAASYQDASEIIADLRAAVRGKHVAAVKTNNPRTWSKARCEAERKGRGK